jgi:hypothetical protein
MKLKPLLISLALIAAIIVVGFGALRFTESWLRSLDPTLAGAFITAALGLLGLGYAKWHSKSRDIAESHRPSKIEVYNTFFDIVERMQEHKGSPHDDGDNPEPDWLKGEFQKFNRGLLLWGSPAVIHAWLKFRTSTENGEHILVAVDRMYQAIRKDLGNSNVGLQSGDLIKIGLKDPNEWRS